MTNPHDTAITSHAPKVNNRTMNTKAGQTDAFRSSPDQPAGK
jgi:hypothetical protein